jgi:tetratricopeptide (TPR) repeat protein
MNLMHCSFRRLILTPRRYPLCSLLAVVVFGAATYLLWELTPGARFRRAYAAAESALAAYDFSEARRRLAECLELRPDDPNVLLLAAQAARRDGDLDAAADHLWQYSRIVGESTESEQIEQAMIYSQRGNVAETAQFLLEFLEIRHPASERIFEALALGSAHSYNLDLTRFWVEKGLERFARNPVLRLVRAQTLIALNWRPQALASLRQIVAEFPRYVSARQSLAEVLLTMREYDEAAGHYEQVSRQLPDKVAPLIGLFRCRDRQGRTTEARSLLDRLRQQHGDDVEVLLECGRVAVRDQDFAIAEPLLSRVVERVPYDNEAHLMLAICLHNLGRSEEAARHVDRAKQIESDMMLLEKIVAEIVKNPADPEPRFKAGQICLRNGQDAEGLRWLQGVLERKPDHKPTHQALSNYYASRGDLQQAEYHRARTH